MHFEFFIEDQSSGKAMEILIPRLLGDEITFRIHTYNGLGRIPPKLRSQCAADKRILLERLPQILRGHNPDCGIIVVICDLDDNDELLFRSDLQRILETCSPKLKVILGLAIEEFEAWYFGDLAAIRKAYPKAIDHVLTKYKNDSICGTWERLADAIYKGGSKALSKKKWYEIGKQKSIWAKEISPHMDVDKNESPSFNFLHSELKKVMADNT
jgi:hypothetical protein